MGAGAAFVLLNILRFLSILTLILVCTASVLIISDKSNDVGENFFSIVSQFFRVVSSLVLITTETPLLVLTKFYTKRCPVWTQGYSLAWSGVPMVVLACGVLADAQSPVDMASKPSNLRKSFVTAAGISVGVIGLTYCLMPLIFWFVPNCQSRLDD